MPPQGHGYGNRNVAIEGSVVLIIELPSKVQHWCPVDFFEGSLKEFSPSPHEQYSNTDKKKAAAFI